MMKETKTNLKDDLYIKAYAVKDGVMIDTGKIISLSELLGELSDVIANYVVNKVCDIDEKND